MDTGTVDYYYRTVQEVSILQHENSLQIIYIRRCRSVLWPLERCELWMDVHGNIIQPSTT